MRRLLLILILTFSFQNLTKADDIRDFQIEGMSIGDSLLDYFSEEEIKKKSRKPNAAKKSKFLQAFFRVESNNFETIAINYKDDDNQYRIHQISGRIEYLTNIEDCYEKMDEITKKVRALFINIKENKKNKSKYRGDKSGKSYKTQVSLLTSDNGRINITCYDFSKTMKWSDGLSVSVASEEWGLFQKNKAYK